MVEMRTESDGDGDGGDVADEEVSATGSFCGDAGSDGLLGLSGESGSTGGAGSSSIGETGSRTGGSGGEWSRGAGGGVFGVGAGWEEGIAAGGVGDGGVSRLDGGEMKKSLISTLSRRSSISLRLFLVLFAGGGGFRRWRGWGSGGRRCSSSRSFSSSWSFRSNIGGSTTPLAAAMTAVALPCSGGAHRWRWQIASYCEDLMPCSMAED
jgi:hypothetical protein